MDFTIDDAIIAESSAACAIRAIVDYVREFIAAPDAPAVLPVRVALGDVIVEHEVFATVNEVRRIGGRETVALDWIPSHSRLYPSFHGTVSVQDRNEAQCRIRIRGSYTPPLGIIGAAAEMIGGRQVAHATLRELLDRFKFRAEAAYRAGFSS